MLETSEPRPPQPTPRLTAQWHTSNGVRTVFLIGPPRSGTTLLSFLLAGGPRVLSLSEPFRLHEVFPRWGLWWTYRGMGKKHGFRAVAPRSRLSDPALLTHLRDVAERNAMNTLVIKETFRSDREWVNLKLLDSFVESGAPVVAIIRHPFDCAVSTIKMFRLWRGIVGHIVRPIVPDLPLFCGDADIAAYVAKTWCDFSAWCAARRVTLIRYEDLVRDPAARVQALCEQCGIAFDEKMMDAKHPRGPFGGIGDPGVMTRPARPVSAKSVGRKKQLAPRLQRIVASGCRDVAAGFGYEVG